MFCNNFTVRLASKFWGGRWTDITIEEKFMAPLKSQAGVTRGRGMTDSTVASFVRAMPACSRVSSAVKSFAGVSHIEEQHSDHRPTNQSRDRGHSGRFFEWLRAHCPFSKPPDELVSLSSGIVGDSSVNCDKVMEIGTESMKKIVGKNFGDLTMQRKDRVFPLSVMTSSIKVKDTVIPIDVQKLFHRIVVLKLSDEEQEVCFRYELAPRSTSIFDGITMRKGNKAALVNTALDKLCPPGSSVPSCPYFVFDGGFLLNVVQWPKPATFEQIAAVYVNYVSNFASRHGGEAVVQFDGYAGGPST